jgi:hypothetical protein
MIKQIATTKKVVTLISILLLIISLTQPAFYTASDTSDSLNLHSVFIFFLGWLGFLGGSFESFFWFAKPLYIYALILFVRNKKEAMVISGAATILALLFLLLPSFIKNESGTRTPITGYGLGYIFWVASLSLLTIETVIENRLNNFKSNE